MKQIYNRYIKPHIPQSWFSLYHHGVRRWLFFIKRQSSKLTPWHKPDTNNLRQYFLKNTGRLIHKCDHYFDIYDRHFARFRNKPVRVLEIGVYHGGSLQMWREYFGAEAQIVGMDINPACQAFAEERIEVVIGSQEDREFLRQFKNRYPKFDIIIDDGGHTMNQQRVTFEELYGHVKEGGVFLAEDLCTSYWSDYGGGYRRPESFLEYSKQFIDWLHAWHTQDPGLAVSEFTRTTDSLHYYDSILVLEKGEHPKPVSHMTGTPSY